MRISAVILLFFFAFGILHRANLLSFLKKTKPAIELSSAEDYDETSDTDENKKANDTKEEMDEKKSHYVTSHSTFIFFSDFHTSKNFLHHNQQLFKSHFKEIVSPPPESIA
ncbi:MAG: hypothetical protein ACTHJT_07265 [Cytophaga sp.]|uniref:hypothetical protein n=1 Tax=Cytophaga sp. TaxID=29535 RepID=UPI003F7DEBEE